MATSIPSHNVAEIIDATLELIDNPHVEHERLMQLFHGPDFATGGQVVDSAASIAEAYVPGAARSGCAASSMRPKPRTPTTSPPGSSGWAAGNGSWSSRKSPIRCPRAS